ncbi:hypothetical protein [Lacticaseibacillus sp. GG6-2]
MVIKAQVIGKIIDVDAYVLVRDRVDTATQRDGALVALTSFVIADNHSDFIVDAFEYAFIDFKDLVDYDWQPDDFLVIIGNVTPLHLMPHYRLIQTRKLIAREVKSMTRIAENWGRRKYKRWQQERFAEQTAAFRRGEINANTWMQNQQALAPTNVQMRRKLAIMQARLQENVTRLDAIIDAALQPAVVFTKATAIHATEADAPLEAQVNAARFLNLFRHSLRKVAPAREQFVADWWRYRDLFRATRKCDADD